VEALAAARRADGFPATCIVWGPWASSASLVGARQLEHLAQMGQGLLSVRLGIRALDALLAGDAGQPVVTAVRWELAREDLDSPLTVELLGQRSSTPAPASRHESILDGLSEPALARQVLEAAVRQHVASLCGLGGPGQVAPTAGFADQGLDSLGAVELRNRLQRDLGERLPATLAFTYPSVQELTTHLTERLVGAAGGAPDSPARPSAADLADLLEAELGGGA
jgi:acyl carrier protein